MYLSAMLALLTAHRLDIGVETGSFVEQCAEIASGLAYASPGPTRDQSTTQQLDKGRAGDVDAVPSSR
jgi:hypothetical protein